MTTGCRPASLCRVRQRRQRAAYTLCPDNGGNSGVSYLAEQKRRSSRSLCSSEGHSAPVCGRGFHLSPLSGPSAQRLLVLFTAIRVIVFSCRSLYQTSGRLSNRDRHASIAQNCRRLFSDDRWLTVAPVEQRRQSSAYRLPPPQLLLHCRKAGVWVRIAPVFHALGSALAALRWLGDFGGAWHIPEHPKRLTPYPDPAVAQATLTGLTQC